METRKLFLPLLTNPFRDPPNTQTRSVRSEPSFRRSHFVQPPKQFLFSFEVLNDRFYDEIGRGYCRGCRSRRREVGEY